MLTNLKIMGIKKILNLKNIKSSIIPILLSTTFLFFPSYIHSQTKTKSESKTKEITQLSQQKSLEQIIEEIPNRLMEEIIINDEEVKVYFSDISSPIKKYYVDKNLTNVDAKKALFTAIMQNLYKKYEKNKEVLEEWEEELRKHRIEMNRKLAARIKKYKPSPFEAHIKDVQEWLNEVLYGSKPLRELLKPHYGRMNPELSFFVIFSNNLIELNIFTPMTFDDAIKMYETISEKENLKKFSSMLLIEKYKPICRQVTAEWVDPDKIADLFTESTIDAIFNYLFIYEPTVKDIRPTYYEDNLFCQGDIEFIEKEFLKKEYDKKYLFGLFAKVGKSRSYAVDDCFSFMAYDIYKQAPFPLPIEDFFRKPYLHDDVKHIYETIKNIDETINSYELIK